MIVENGDQVLSLPALQAVIRALIAQAAKGNGPAQRLLITFAKQIEQELGATLNPSDVNREGEQPLTHEEALELLE